MGLDMYLQRKVYVGANFEHREITGTVELFVGKEKRPLQVNFNRINTITENVGYWRKANAIHRWFVENTQNGVDECQETYVSKEQLKTLLDICKSVKKNHALAPQLLPTQGGFFFGSTDYNEYYFDDINSTIEILQPIVDSIESDTDSVYYYRSSW